MIFFRLFFTIRTTAVRAFELIRDVRVPLRLKVLAVLAAVFILSPLNILGDIPLIGIVDDAALLALLLNWFVRASEPHVEIAHPLVTVH
jgi:uncharacterized membrane protein YkvA (DUF1232 family)